jgi:uncharacterized protein with von Willebrand factor type A (vWA) domain
VAESERIVAGFARALRTAGVAVPTGSAVLYAEALARVGLGAPGAVYWAGRATLIRRPEDIATYDRVFKSYWRDAHPEMEPEAAAGRSLTLAFDEDDADEGIDPGPDLPDPAGAEDMISVRYSAVEVLRHQDLASLSAAEWAEAQRLISALGVSAELRRTRRARPVRRAGTHPDLRRTVRSNLAHGGIPMRRAWRAPASRPRRLVLLLDVSGSMEPYARGLARFAHAAVASRRAGQVEVFTIGTRLTRITRDLRRRDPDAALASAASSVSDWSGGTRLGASLQEFNDRWGSRGIARGAIVVICSDGWDRGDPALIGAEMGRLARVARRVVWVNPLKASPGYAPLARGMAAALPFVDQFVEGHAVASLERLAEIIAGGVSRAQEMQEVQS